MATYFTRLDLLDSEEAKKDRAAAHRKYFGQFVTPAVLRLVESHIGKARILASTDPHLNDIPLPLWDRMNEQVKYLCLSKMGDVNGAVSVNEYGQRRISWSLSDAVCIAKEAARQIKEQAGAEGQS